MQNWTTENLPEFGPHLSNHRVTVWFHDETIFYAHDRQKRLWIYKDIPAKPYAKGDGASLMIAHYISADFGWLVWGDSLAQQIHKPEKNRDGYFSSDVIIEQAHLAMDIALKNWPEFDHVFIYDNASTHLKQPDDAISAQKMLKNTPKVGANWGIKVKKRDPLTGKPLMKPDGKPEKMKIPMGNTQFEDGHPQPLYFPPGHEHAGVFKGMQVILEERGSSNASKLLAECKQFKCTSPTNNCCCRRISFNQLDFALVPSILESE
ncbi:hypothetical protein B0H34DRAFT_793028 [Crassisporium funariophilum]|nr:hypothetical protein B0H34DRAFT_793028 [Crassisporium funariophilum]